MTWWRLTKAETIRRDALGIALAAHEGQETSAVFLIQEAERIATYIKSGEQFLPRDRNEP